MAKKSRREVFVADGGISLMDARRFAFGGRFVPHDALGVRHLSLAPVTEKALLGGVNTHARNDTTRTRLPNKARIKSDRTR